MPNFDQTGPLGAGPKTGRQRGKCVNTNPQGRPLDGRGRGQGVRRGGKGFNSNRG